MGEKTSARREAVAAGVPVVPGTLEPLADEGELAREAERIGYPVMLKAAAGGGGKGLRLVADAGASFAPPSPARARRRGAPSATRASTSRRRSRGRGTSRSRSSADHHGNAVHLFERECSIQRRHQKVIEESPSPLLTPELRQRMGELAVALVRRTGYVNAGTLEFLVDEDRKPCFLEMNTRLQVEHPVTEMVTGVDLVKLQIRIAQGEPLPLRQEDLAQRGHAIECRVYAEDPDAGFLPSPGTHPGAARARRARGARRLGRLRGLDGPHPLRPARLEARRLGGEPGRGHPPHAPRGRGVPGRRDQDDAPLLRAGARPPRLRGRGLRHVVRRHGARGREGPAGRESVEIAVAAAAIRAFEERRAARAVAGRRRRRRLGVARGGAPRGPRQPRWGARVDLRRDRRGPHDPRGGAGGRRALHVEPRRLAARGGPRPRRAATSRASSSAARATRSASRSGRRASSSASRARR